jgi:hypothetical protein
MLLTVIMTRPLSIINSAAQPYWPAWRSPTNQSNSEFDDAQYERDS